jgi:oxygen-independent coproporphyrinogen III oxidase
LGAWKKQGKLKEVEDEYAEEQFNILTKTLKELGYEQYEVSNFAKNGAYAVHNTSYWKNKAYLGIGPSAHSYDLEKRFANIANNAKYIKALEEGYLATQEEILSITDKANDYILCGLRTIWGINISILKEIAGEVPKEFYEALNEFIMNGWVTMRSQNIVITEKGRIFSDRITSSLFFE